MESVSSGMPRISVIVPVYNAQATLERCVQSVALQTLPDWELLLVDNNSIDDSPTIAAALAGRDARIHTARQPLQGVSATRNLGIDKAQGEYLFFLDSDDTIAPTALERMLDEAEHSGSDIVFPAIARITPGKDGGIRRNATGSAYIHPSGQKEIAETFAQGLGRYALFNAVGLYRRSLFEAPPLRFDEALSLGEDVCLNMAAMANSTSISLLAEPLYEYWYGFYGDSLNTKYRADMVAIKLGLGDAIRAFIAERGAWDAVAEQSFAAMQTQDVFMCTANLLRMPGGRAAQRAAFSALLQTPQVRQLIDRRREWSLSLGKRCFLAALKSRSFSVARLAVWFYQFVNG